jgi:hypothetical protein
MSVDSSTSRRWLAVALALWAATTLGHGLGLEWSGTAFAWAERGDNWLSEAGGVEGVRRIEVLLAAFFAAGALMVFGVFVARVRRLHPDRAALAQELLPWLVWTAFVLLVHELFMIYATEWTHFAQYALVGGLLAWAFDRGRKPQLAFLLAVGLGVVDELHQHYWLHAGDPAHFFDWTDPVLNALGAVLGVLPLVSLRRLSGERFASTFGLLRRTVAIAACVLLPLLLLSPATHAQLFGHYTYDPYWVEFRNDTPVHWPAPGEGIPLVLASLIVLGLIVEPRPRPLGRGGLAVLLGLAFLAVQPPSRLKGMPVHEVVPRTVAPRTPTPIEVDGVLEEAWETAPRLGPFLENLEGGVARQRTFARVLWDSDAIYFAFEVEDNDVWARDTIRDDRSLPNDEVVEVFLDDGGDEVTYFEIEVSPKNAVQDLFVFIPRAPVEFDPNGPLNAMNAWDARGLRTAVVVDGTVDVEGDRDRGYVVEIALPWEAIAPYPNNRYAHRTVPPKVGDTWRLGLFRIDRPRGDGDEAEFQGWAPTRHASFHVPRFFGVLRFGD